MTSFLKDGPARAVAVWLFFVAVLVLAMVVVGGATRLTGSGLSITEWAPVNGILPPLSEAAWRKAFALYQATPQYKLVNKGMSLSSFQFIFWWEWSHRLLGRLVGAAFAIPFVFFLVTRRLPPRLLWRCVLLLILGGLQGAVGWWMVMSGLDHRVSVAPERLATHLGLALVLLCGLLWTMAEAWAGPARPRAVVRDSWRPVSLIFLFLVLMQCLMGALVAGNSAGLIDNDWPLMNGLIFPADYASTSFWATVAHSAPAVQFNHRIMAYCLVIFAVGITGSGLNSRFLMGQTRVLTLLVGVIAIVQATLGVATLLAGDTLPLALAHQAGAALLLSVAALLAWRVRRM